MSSVIHAFETQNRLPMGQRSRLLRWATHAALLLLLAAFAIKGFIPGWRHLNSDFPNYYLVARLYRAGYPLQRVYDWTWLQREKDHQGINQGLVSFMSLTPFSTLPVMPWCSLSPLEAKRRWLVLNLAFAIVVVLLLSRITRLGWEQVALLMLLAFLPLSHNFVFGQMHLLVLFLITLAAWLFLRNKHFLSGMSLACAAALKIYPALFLIYFVWKRQWRAAVGLAAGITGVCFISLFMFGQEASTLYLRKVLPAGLRGETIDPYNVAWNSWTALLRRLFIAEPELNPAPVAHLPLLYAVLQPLVHASILIAFLWAIGRQRDDVERTKIEWATFLFLLLFLSSQPATYHLVALIFTAALVVDYLLLHKQWVRSGLVLVTYCLICAPPIRIFHAEPHGWQNLLFFSRLAAMSTLGGLLLGILSPHSRGAWKECLGFNRTRVAVLAVILMTAIGFVLTERHLQGQFDNYRSRIATAPDELFAASPAPTSAGVLFNRMIPQGYTVRSFQNALSTDLSAGSGDWFHPTVALNTDAAWAENATSNSSRIVRIVVDRSGQTRSTQIEVDDAQEPVISRDGRYLAFLRSVKGRNSLWVRQNRSFADVSEVENPREVAGEEYNVHEASFMADDRLVFSSKRDGRFRLFIATPAGGDIKELSLRRCSARYPAASPDGRWMAFSCDQGSGSQIQVTDLEGRQELQLTSGDCNSISPAWTADSKHLIYATDCGRGLGLTALAQAAVFP